MNPSLSGKLRLLGAFELFAAIGAFYGGGSMVARPDGSLLGMKPDMLAGSPFSTFFVPGLLAVVVLGGFCTAAAFLAFLRHTVAPLFGGLAGSLMMTWAAGQVELVGYLHPMQPLLFTIGLVVLALGALAFRAARGERAPA